MRACKATFGSFVLQHSATDLYNGACQAVWNNGGDTASLYNGSAALVDTHAY